MLDKDIQDVQTLKGIIRDKSIDTVEDARFNDPSIHDGIWRSITRHALNELEDDREMNRREMNRDMNCELMEMLADHRGKDLVTMFGKTATDEDPPDRDEAWVRSASVQDMKTEIFSTLPARRILANENKELTDELRADHPDFASWRMERSD